MSASSQGTNNILLQIGGLRVNADGQLSDDFRAAVQQLLPTGPASQGLHIPPEALMPGGDPQQQSVPQQQQQQQQRSPSHNNSQTHSLTQTDATSSAHVVNIENSPMSSRNNSGDSIAGMGGGGGLGAAHVHTHNQPQQQQLPSLKQLLKSMQGSFPFILLVLTKILYDHRLGILVFVGLFGTFYHANSSLKKQISSRETGSWLEWYGSLAWIITFLTANITFIYYIFDEQQLYRSLYLGIPIVNHLDVWHLFWIVVINDFIIKFLTVIVKALVAVLPKQLLPYKKKGKYYLLLEKVSQCYRSLVPITPWIYFLQDDQHGGPWFSAVLVILYTICKGGHVYSKALELKKAFFKFKVDVSYGLPAPKSQLDASDNCCPICQDKYSDPVMLSCKHIFCEDCVSLWFDRERTCPMCRANIVDDPQWRDGNTNANLQIY